MTVGELAVLQRLSDPLDKHIYLRDLRSTDEQAFFRLLLAHSDSLLPVVYTPTVGLAAQQYHELPEVQPAFGLYITSDDAGHVVDVLRRWPKLVRLCFSSLSPSLLATACHPRGCQYGGPAPGAYAQRRARSGYADKVYRPTVHPQRSVRIVVLTDGERVLGLGDLGAGGLAISEGKSLLYTVAAGVPPDWCLPLCLDVGTNNASLRNDPGYKGLRRARLRGPTYEALVEEVVQGLKTVLRHVVLQWEDFGAENAFRLLEIHRHRTCCFNDDIQGTAAVAVAGLLSGLRAAGVAPQNARLLFLGAGEAGTGIGQLWVQYLQARRGMDARSARQTCWFMDSQGLVCASRRGGEAAMAHHKRQFAHTGVVHITDVLAAVRQFKPHALVGVSAQPGAFNADVLAAMAAQQPRPIIMPLSNPTSLSECTAEEAFKGTKYSCLFASGSPFDAVSMPDGRKLLPSQANNAYVFPALGLGASLAQATSLPDDTFLLAAEVLASLVSEDRLHAGILFPPIAGVRDCSARIAAAVAAHSVAGGRGIAPAGVATAGGWEAYVRAHMWHPQPEQLAAKL